MSTKCGRSYPLIVASGDLDHLRFALARVAQYVTRGVSKHPCEGGLRAMFRLCRFSAAAYTRSTRLSGLVKCAVRTACRPNAFPQLELFFYGPRIRMSLLQSLKGELAIGRKCEVSRAQAATSFVGNV